MLCIRHNDHSDVCLRCLRHIDATCLLKKKNRVQKSLIVSHFQNISDILTQPLCRKRSLFEQNYCYTGLCTASSYVAAHRQAFQGLCQFAPDILEK